MIPRERSRLVPKSGSGGLLGELASVPPVGYFVRMSCRRPFLAACIAVVALGAAYCNFGDGPTAEEQGFRCKSCGFLESYAPPEFAAQ
jgi:hypothetical protein